MFSNPQNSLCPVFVKHFPSGPQASFSEYELYSSVIKSVGHFKYMTVHT